MLTMIASAAKPTSKRQCVATEDAGYSMLTPDDGLALHRTALKAGVRRSAGAPQLRHAHAVELLHEGIPLPLIERQLGHWHRSITGTYLQGIDREEMVSTVHSRPAPRMHASAGVAL